MTLVEEKNEAEMKAGQSVWQWPGAIFRGVAMALIRSYQHWISPLTPPSCFFYPTCSHYTYQAIERFGFMRGGWLGVHRLCRCHPLTRGGYDPVPEKWTLWPGRVKSAAEKSPENQQARSENFNDVAVTDGLRDLDE